MTELYDGILLYHGSYTDIPRIDLEACSAGLDFGKGFYLTSSYEQAYNYVQLSVKKAKRIGNIPDQYCTEDGYISIYKFHYDPNLLTCYFPTANNEWLHFVAANRNRKLFPRLLQKYNSVDIIGGKIADDQTARTLQMYVNGDVFGKPGTAEADTAVIKRLLPNRLKDQFCFRTQEAISQLQFIRGDRYGDIRI